MNWRVVWLGFVIGLAVASGYFTASGETRMGLVLCGVLCGLTMFRLLLLRRKIKQLIQEERELLAQTIPLIEQAIDEAEQAAVEANRRRGLDTSTRVQMLHLQLEISDALKERGSDG